MPFWVYILRCCDGSFYVGHSDDLERRKVKNWSRAKKVALITSDWPRLSQLAR